MTDDNAVGDLQHDYFASIWEYSILPCYRICGISDNNDKLTIFSITNYVVCNKLINLKCARNCHSNQNVTGILSHTTADTVSVLFNKILNTDYVIMRMENANVWEAQLSLITSAMLATSTEQSKNTFSRFDITLTCNGRTYGWTDRNTIIASSRSA